MPQTRQLAAIMFTDIVGYTALMGKDEQKAFDIIQKNRSLQKPIIEKYNGRWIKELGDGVMASFATVSDAVYAAKKIQEQCRQSGWFSLRIGIHQGEIVIEDDDIFGDAVNIASRIQTLGIPGSILFSKKIADEIKNKVEFQTVSLGNFQFKNVNEPIEVFALANDGFPVPKRSMMEGKLKKRNFQKRNIIAALSFILLVVTVFFIYKYFFAKNDKAEVSDKSIAVLPFVDMSAGKDQEYFSDGLSEELLNLLSKIPELKVIGRTSSFSFKGKNEDLRIIGEKLDVAHILEGSVQKDGNKIRVTAQLIRTADGFHLWSEKYDRDLEGIFKLQDEIAGAVVNQLKLKLLTSTANTASSINTEVYNLILQGDYFIAKRDKVSLAIALDFYLKALAIDSLNARSWAAVAECYNLQSNWGWIDRTQGKEKASQAAIKSIELNNNQAKGRKVLGAIKVYHYDWAGAEAEYKKALEIEPGNADVLRILGFLYRCLGRFDEAIQLTRQSIALDPVQSITYFNFGQLLYHANHLEEAIAAYKKVLELNPQFPRAHIFLGKVYLLQGKPDWALAEMVQETGEEAWKNFGLILAYQALSHKKETDTLLQDYLLRFQKENKYQIAEIYAFRGEKNKAFEYLEKAYIGMEGRLNYLKGDPLLKNLEGDPRYKAFLKKMNLPVN